MQIGGGSPARPQIVFYSISAKDWKRTGSQLYVSIESMRDVYRMCNCQSGEGFGLGEARSMITADDQMQFRGLDMLGFDSANF